MRRRLATIALLAALLTARPSRAQDGMSERWDARVTAVTGEVAVHPADGSDPVAAEEGMPLEEGDRVVTSEGAEAELSLDGESLITLQANSDFTLTRTAKQESEFTLALGSMLAKIQKLANRRLRVRTPTAVAAVRGTEFGVDAEAGQSHVGVFDEGRVEVQGQGATEVLTPNQETSVQRGRAPLKPFALKRFAARRQMMLGRIQRLQAVRRRWQKMPPGARKRRRLKALKRRLKAMRQKKKALNKAAKKLRRQNQLRQNKADDER